MCSHPCQAWRHRTTRCGWESSADRILRERRRHALEQKDERTEADDARLEELRAKKEQMSDAFDTGAMSNAQSISDMAANIQKFPPMANGLRAAGMTPREHATFMMAMLQASMVAGFKKSGMMKEIPKDVNVENVRFIEEHQKGLEALGSGGH